MEADTRWLRSLVSRCSMHSYILTYYRLMEKESVITLGSHRAHVCVWGGGGGGALISAYAVLHRRWHS